MFDNFKKNMSKKFKAFQDLTRKAPSKAEKDRVENVRFQLVTQLFLESRGYQVADLDDVSNKIEFTKEISDAKRREGLSMEKDPDHLVLGYPLSPANSKHEMQLFDTFLCKPKFRGSSQQLSPEKLNCINKCIKNAITRKVAEKNQTHDVVLEIKPFTEAAQLIQTEEGFNSLFDASTITNIRKTKGFNSVLVVFSLNDTAIQNKFQNCRHHGVAIDEFLLEAGNVCRTGSLENKQNYCRECELSGSLLHKNNSSFKSLPNATFLYDTTTELSTKVREKITDSLIALYVKTILPVASKIFIPDTSIAFVHEEIKGFLIGLEMNDDRPFLEERLDEEYRRIMQRRLHLGQIIGDAFTCYLLAFYYLSRVLYHVTPWKKPLANHLICLLTILVLANHVGTWYVPYLPYVMSICCVVSFLNIAMILCSKFVTPTYYASCIQNFLGIIWLRTEQVFNDDEARDKKIVGLLINLAVVVMCIPIVTYLFDKLAMQALVIASRVFTPTLIVISIIMKLMQLLKIVHFCLKWVMPMCIICSFVFLIKRYRDRLLQFRFNCKQRKTLNEWSDDYQSYIVSYLEEMGKRV